LLPVGQPEGAEGVEGPEGVDDVLQQILFDFWQVNPCPQTPKTHVATDDDPSGHFGDLFKYFPLFK